jgi:hypothetical protein
LRKKYRPKDLRTSEHTTKHSSKRVPKHHRKLATEPGIRFSTCLAQ